MVAQKHCLRGLPWRQRQNLIRRVGDFVQICVTSFRNRLEFYLRWTEFDVRVYECGFRWKQHRLKTAFGVSRQRATLSANKKNLPCKKKTVFVERQELWLLNNNLWTLCWWRHCPPFNLPLSNIQSVLIGLFVIADLPYVILLLFKAHAGFLGYDRAWFLSDFADVLRLGVSISR